MDTSQLITWGMSSIALFMSGLSLYFQRRDKRPHLRIDFIRSYMHVPADSNKPTSYRPFPNLKIHIRNPTERTVKISSINFIDGKKSHWELPQKWLSLDEVPAHDERVFSLPLREVRDWAKDTNIPYPEKGKLVIKDALGYEYKSEKLGDLSLEAVRKF